MKLNDLTNKLKGVVPTVQWPTLGRTVQIPVYLVHNSANTEDYFFIFDFAQFVEKSREGLFVRPMLQVWAGRDDFDRAAFGRKFRQSFAEEFDAARHALETSEEADKGWFSWGGTFEAVSTLGASWVANVILLVATSAGRSVWNALPVPRLLRGKSDETKLEDEIAGTQAKVDAALTAMQITLHSELSLYAYQGKVPEHVAAAGEDAWPLPNFVQEHLGKGSSTAWW